MYKENRKHKNDHSDYDLYADVEEIKAALANMGHDIRGRAGEMFTHSVDNVKEKSAALQDNVANYTAEKPFKSLGIALLAGMIIGYVLHK